MATITLWSLLCSGRIQRLQHQVVEGLLGVLSIHNDILVYGEGDTYEEAHQHHDRKLENLMRCQERIVKLSKEKMKLQRNEVPYICHVLTNKGLKPDPNKIKVMLEMPKPTDMARVEISIVNCVCQLPQQISALPQ